MDISFDASLAFTCREEGGYVSDPRDSGNWSSGRVGIGQLIGSNMGVGAAALEAWLAPSGHASAEIMRELQKSTYQAIARENYWIPMWCGNLPVGLDVMAFDFGWNRGPVTSRKLLLKNMAISDEKDPCRQIQLLENAFQSIPPDDLIRGLCKANAATLQQALHIDDDGIAGPATMAALRERPDLYSRAIIMGIADAQIRSYRTLNNFSTYGAGWLARTARRQTVALAAVGIDGS